jgi:hypothetical protein
LLSGIVHLNQDHVCFSTKEIENISGEVLQSFYNQDMEDNDIQRAGEAVVLWTSWVQVSFEFAFTFMFLGIWDACH